MPRVDFPTLLARRMEARNLNQTDLAKRLGVDQAQVSRWKSAQTTAGRDQWPAIADALDVSLDTISKAVGRTKLVKERLTVTQRLSIVTEERDSLARENAALQEELQRLRKRLQVGR